MAKILFIIAQKDFRDEEFFIPKDVLKSFEQEVASITTNTAVGALGGETIPDIDLGTALENIKTGAYRAVIFVGGAGAKEYFADKTALDIARAAGESSAVKALAAICIAPLILAKARVLEGKKATVWDDGQGTQVKILEDAGAVYVAEDVVADGKLITANGPKAAKKFGEAVLRKLS